MQIAKNPLERRQRRKFQFQIWEEQPQRIVISLRDLNTAVIWKARKDATAQTRQLQVILIISYSKCFNSNMFDSNVLIHMFLEISLFLYVHLQTLKVICTSIMLLLDVITCFRSMQAIQSSIKLAKTKITKGFQLSAFLIGD